MANEQQLLEEILPTPANDIKTERFAQDNEAASCSGGCKSGACRTFV